MSSVYRLRRREGTEAFPAITREELIDWLLGELDSEVLLLAQEMHESLRHRLNEHLRGKDPEFAARARGTLFWTDILGGRYDEGFDPVDFSAN